MGFNTTVLILNDAVHTLTEDKDFPEKLVSAIHEMYTKREPVDVSILGHVNAVTVLAQEHADIMQILAIGGNTGWVLGSGSCYNSAHLLLRTLAEQHGFRLVKTTKKRRFSSIGVEPCQDCEKGADYGLCYDCKAHLDKNLRCIKKCGGRR